MKIKCLTILFIASCFFLIARCKNKQDSTTYILIETNLGNIKIKLYDETPIHKANFIKLVNEGYYNDLLFHRVIDHFMIQGGDPTSRNASDTAQLGSGDPGYTLPAEINPIFFHKRGVLAAARELDATNPQRRSSGSQFYIVQGHTFTDDELDITEKKINQNSFQNQVNQAFAAERDSFHKQGIPSIYDTIIAHASTLVRSYFVPFHFNPEQRITYKTTGGAPHLDGSFTIFGETIDGFDVIDKIASVPTAGNDRPITPVKMKISIIK